MGSTAESVFKIEIKPNFLYYLRYILIYSGPVFSLLGFFKYMP